MTKQQFAQIVQELDSAHSDLAAARKVMEAYTRNFELSKQVYYARHARFEEARDRIKKEGFTEDDASDGTSGQDRTSYTDDQDRKSYTVSFDSEEEPE